MTAPHAPRSGLATDSPFPPRTRTRTRNREARPYPHPRERVAEAGPGREAARRAPYRLDARTGDLLLDEDGQLVQVLELVPLAPDSAIAALASCTGATGLRLERLELRNPRIVGQFAVLRIHHRVAVELVTACPVQV